MVFCNAGSYGTLAAVRSLGRAGVPVVTADPAILLAGRFSRFSGMHLNCPPFEMTRQWIDWLLKLGQSGPRRVLYASSDAVSFALAGHRDELSAYFDLYQPDLQAIMGILDKGALLKHARAVGFELWHVAEDVVGSLIEAAADVKSYVRVGFRRGGFWRNDHVRDVKGPHGRWIWNKVRQVRCPGGFRFR